MKVLYILIGCILSGILYRMGGAEGYNTKWRDMGCPLVVVLCLWLLNGVHWNYWWAYLLFFGLSWGALSTYWDWLFGYDNYYVHGVGCGLAGVALLWVGIPWWILVIRLLLCAGMGLWSKYIKRDVPQEIGRGVLFIL